MSENTNNEAMHRKATTVKQIGVSSVGRAHLTSLYHDHSSFFTVPRDVAAIFENPTTEGE